MVKSISAMNNMAKRGILGTMLAASVLSAGASNLGNKANVSNLNQTEVASKNSAEALKSLSLPQINQTKVPTVHNTKLDNILRKFATTPEKRKMIENVIGNVYKEYGTYHGSALIQHTIDVQNFLYFLSGNTDIMKTINPDVAEMLEMSNPNVLELITSNRDKFMKRVNGDISPRIMKAMGSFDHVPTAEEMSAMIEFITDNYPLLNSDDREMYIRWWIDCKVPFEGSSVKEQSDLIAKQMHLLDTVIFIRLLQNAGVLCNDSSDKTKFSELKFIRWMDAISLFKIK